MMIKNGKSDIKFAFKQSVPVMFGYLFLGIAFGLMLQNAGYHFIWAFAISVCVYAGSMQFVLVTLLSGGASLIYTAVMTLFINGRHIFYGLSFIERYKKMGKACPYMIFSLTDETYSLLCRTKIPSDLNEKRVTFWISALDQCYWVAGSVIGGLAGQLITFDSTGIDFSMTALFVAIVVEQWKESRSKLPAAAGFLASVFFLLVLGPDRFILPSLTLSAVLLLAARGRLKEEGKKDERESEMIQEEKMEARG